MRHGVVIPIGRDQGITRGIHVNGIAQAEVRLGGKVPLRSLAAEGVRNCSSAYTNTITLGTHVKDDQSFQHLSNIRPKRQAHR